MAIEKTGILVDTSTSFTNPSRFEEAGKVSTISASNLTPNTRYYVKGYVVQDGTTIYSNNVQNFYTDDTDINYLTFTNAYSGTNYLELQKIGSPYEIILQYTKDGSNWITWDSSSGSSIVVSLEEGEHVSFRGDNTNFTQYYRGRISGSSSEHFDYYKFSSSEDIRCSGSIMTLVDKSNRRRDLINDRYDYVKFGGLFNGMTHLLSAPELPATSLAPYCYMGLFEGCTSLTVAPELPATYIYNESYYKMYTNCTSLTTASIMYVNEVQSTGSNIVGNRGSFGYMYSGCSALTDIRGIHFNMQTAQYQCLSYCFNNCTSLTTAPALPSTTIRSKAYSHIFDNCTSLTTAPALPSTDLFEECYSYAFYNCTSLLETPALPSVSVPKSAYKNMFCNCTSLRIVSNISSTTIGSHGMDSMFRNCSSITAIPTLNIISVSEYALYHIFDSCTSLISVQSKLPCQILKPSCYSYAFYNCSSLRTAPELPAGTIESSSYSYMFANCRNLSEVKVYAQNWSTSDTSNWLQNVSATGDFYNLGGAQIPTGISGIPQGWNEYTSL